MSRVGAASAHLQDGWVIDEILGAFADQMAGLEALASFVMEVHDQVPSGTAPMTMPVAHAILHLCWEYEVLQFALCQYDSPEYVDLRERKHRERLSRIAERQAAQGGV